MTQPGFESALSIADLELFRRIGAVIVIHGNDASAPRPGVTLPALWFGASQPSNMIEGDVFVQVTSIA